MINVFNTQCSVLQKTHLSCWNFSEKIKYLLNLCYFVVALSSFSYCAYMFSVIIKLCFLYIYINIKKKYIYIYICDIYVCVCMYKRSSNLAVVYPEGFQEWYAGLGTQLYIQLMKNSQEKFSLIQILREKIFIAIVSKHFTKLNFMISSFLKKAIETVFMLCFNQFILQILNWCAFYTSLLVLMFPQLEVFNPRNIQGCLKYYLNVIKNFFLGTFLEHILMTDYIQSRFEISH